MRVAIPPQCLQLLCGEGLRCPTSPVFGLSLTSAFLEALVKYQTAQTFQKRDAAFFLGMELFRELNGPAQHHTGVNSYLGGWSAFRMAAMTGDFIGSGRLHSRH